jgi:predicted GIY-YIG superfamily endonuclease
MHFVYFLESADGTHWYVGVTDNVVRRLEEHNEGGTHTNKHKPWRVKSYTAFTDRSHAEAFERYLKSHSGRAFAKKHL